MYAENTKKYKKIWKETVTFSIFERPVNQKKHLRVI